MIKKTSKMFKCLHHVKEITRKRRQGENQRIKLHSRALKWLHMSDLNKSNLHVPKLTN